MPRKRIPIIPNQTYNLSARCINQEWFRIPLNDVWSLFSDYTHFIKMNYNVKIHNFVLMSNHFHMLATPTEENLGEAMNYFMKETSLYISRKSGRINQVYGAPYHKTLIDTNHYLMHAYKYIYRNPVEAGLCKRVEEYPYSTLSGLLGFNKLIFPVENDLILFDGEIEKNLNWLNNSYTPEDSNSIKMALRRPVFSFAKNRSNASPNHLEKIIY